MLLTKTTRIKTHTRSKKYYEELGYDMSGEYVIIETKDLPKYSRTKVKYKCDNCNTAIDVECMVYNMRKQDFDTCFDCKHITLKKNLQEKYGVDNVFQLDEVKEKSKETLKLKYGVEHPMESDEVREKLKQTNLDRYGVENTLQSEEIRDKIKATNLDKYGVEYPLQSEEIREKSKETLKLKYGVEHPILFDEFKEKIKQTNLNIYGVENVFQNKDIIERIKKIKIELGYQTEITDEYILYKHKIMNLTVSIKEKLYENWDGYDYYDNEYIKGNLDLHYNDPDYPTIDHKTSTLYGYLNDIPPEDICDLENLCITKRRINSSKKAKCEDEFKG